MELGSFCVLYNFLVLVGHLFEGDNPGLYSFVFLCWYVICQTGRSIGLAVLSVVVSISMYFEKY